MSNLENENKCPVDTALKYLGKKWIFQIIRDLFLGGKKFTDFLISNPNLSSKVLSERLKELKINGLIDKTVSNTFPVLIEYKLTPKGKGLNKVIYELASFAMKNCPEYTEQNRKRFFEKGELKKNLRIGSIN